MRSMIQPVSIIQKVRLKPERLASLSRRFGRNGRETYVDAYNKGNPVSEIQRYIEKLGPLQEKYPLVACARNSAMISSFSWNLQDITTFAMSKVMRVPQVGPFKNLSARKYCSGSKPKDVAREIQRAKRDYGLTNGIFNWAGEHTESLIGVQENMQQYFRIIELVSMEFPRELGGASFSGTTVSMKPSQFGTYMGESELREIFPEIFSQEGDDALWIARHLFTLNNMTYVAEYAKEKRVDIWVDMEDHRLTTFTAHVLYPSLVEDENIGLVIQGNLTRTPVDLEVISKVMDDVEHKLRSCKGVYYFPEFDVYVPMGERTETFMELNRAIVEVPSKHGIKIVFASGSMDIDSQRETVRAVQEKDDERLRFRMQVLKGCFGDNMVDLARKNDIPLDIYFNFGKMIFPYSLRRLRKSPIVQQMMGGMEKHPLLIVPSKIYARFYEKEKPKETLPTLL
ncbi:MAG: proline dehydrogenase family protein [Candidatus Micrarchaeota archaeon]